VKVRSKEVIPFGGKLYSFLEILPGFNIWLANSPLVKGFEVGSQKGEITSGLFAKLLHEEVFQRERPNLDGCPRQKGAIYYCIRQKRKGWVH